MENMTNNNTTEYMIGVWILTILAEGKNIVCRGKPGETLPELRKRVANHLTKLIEKAHPDLVNPQFWLTSGGFVALSIEKWCKVPGHPHGGYFGRTPPDLKFAWEARLNYVPATLDEDYRLVPVTD
jgi:hypothetical protein